MPHGRPSSEQNEAARRDSDKNCLLVVPTSVTVCVVRCICSSKKLFHAAERRNC
jgi:hypothetical protein